MKINIKNKEKMQLVLNNAQKKARTRFCQIGDIENLVRESEKYLKSFSIPKKYWTGCVFEYAEHVNCNSYHRNGSYYADSTEIQIARGASDWFLTVCFRTSLPTSNGNNNYGFVPSESCKTWAKENLYNQFLSGF
jgi:hypothetical protein